MLAKAADSPWVVQEVTATHLSNMMWALAVCLPESEAFFSKLAAKLANIPLRELGKDTLIRVLEVSDFFSKTACPSPGTADNLIFPWVFTICGACP